MATELFNLSFAVQVAIVSGYLAYLVAYSGVRQHHTAADTVLKSFAFGLVAAAIMKFGYKHPIGTPLAAFIVTLLVGMLWRGVGLDLWQKALRRTGVTWSDDIPTAWLTITAVGTKARPSQIVVDIEGGRSLMCDDTSKFAEAPFGPCVFGLDGGVALYVTSEFRNGEWINHPDTSHRIRGDKITYIPAAAVKRVEIRHWTEEANGMASQEAAQCSVEGSEAEPRV
jgi:hypothetical protein